MAPGARKDASAMQKAQEKEIKRARGALSCAECRRLKLKCDKTVPCASCKRRGCAAICPNGSLITGQGTRFVLADTEKLHQKITQMSDRIRLLEDALGVLQATVTTEPHPLLERDLLKIKSSIELHSAVQQDDVPAAHEGEQSEYIDAFGTLALRDDGGATFYGASAGADSLLISEPSSTSLDSHPAESPAQSHPNSEIHPSVADMARAFPLSSSYSGLTFRDILLEYRPSWEEARRLSNLYLEQAPWFFGAVTRRQIDEELLPLWYDEPSLASPLSPLATTSSSSLSLNAVPSRGGPHELALLFIVFTFGALTDMNMPPAPDNVAAEQYYTLAKACLNFEPVLDRPPSVSTVQTLSLMGIYEGLKSSDSSTERTWAIFGIATKLAQSIGLHRDCARWSLTPYEVQKRRALFWELFITDGWQSLATGRLATFSLPFVDCELPADPDQTMADDGSIQPSFPFWKARFGAECVSAVIQSTLTTRAPRYAIILELDRKVRDMELPKYTQGPAPQGRGLGETMSYFMPTNYRNLTLLYIHRCFFAHAITSNPADPISTPYAPSFLAGYRTACALLHSIKQQFMMFPEQIARFWVLWTHAFSSTVMIASIVTDGPKSKVAPAALLELRTASDLFEKAAQYGGRAVKFLPIIRRLQLKAQKVYYDTCSGLAPSPPDIFTVAKTEDSDNALSIFSGKTRTLTTRVSTSNPRASPPASTGSNPSPSPPQVFADNPSFANAHPSLVLEFNQFEGHLNEQLQRAYNENDDLAQTLASHPAFDSRRLASLQQTHKPVKPDPGSYQQQQFHHVTQPTSQPHGLQISHVDTQPSVLSPSPSSYPSSPVESLPSPTGAIPGPSHMPSMHMAQYGNVRPSEYDNRHVQQQRHELYTMPPEYMPHHAQRPTSQQPTPSSAQFTGGGQPLGYSGNQMQNNPQYWQNPEGAGQYHNQRMPVGGYPAGHGQEVHYPTQFHLQTSYPDHYTPDGALKGIAAEDNSLQETWQQSFRYPAGMSQ